MLLKLTKSARNCQHRNPQNWKLSFRNFLLQHGPRIKDKELHDKEQKYTQTSLIFTFQRNFRLKFFCNFLTKRNS